MTHEPLESDPRITFYMPRTQLVTDAITVVVQTSVDAGGLTAAVKHELRQLDPGLPVDSVRTIQQRRRFFKSPLAVFAGVSPGVSKYPRTRYSHRASPQ